MLDARITELETRLTYQDDLVQTLNEIVTKQQKQIQQLEWQYSVLHERIKNIADDEGVNQGVEIPPHY